MTILITGVAGFIGSHVQDALFKAGHKVIVGVDNLAGGFKRNINEQTHFCQVDLTDAKALEEVFSNTRPDVVYHLAADATEGRSQFTPMSATRNNLLASVNVFSLSAKYKVKRVIFTSSMSVYGKQTPPFAEFMDRKPVDVYGVNKAAAEHILEILAGVHGFEYIIIRPHNVFGERQNMRDAYRNVVGIFMNRVLSGKPPVIYGDGEQVRSFTYIDNILPCFLEALTTTHVNTIYNVGPVETQTINHLAKTVLKELESDLIPTYVADRPLEVKHAHCTMDKAQTYLRYKTDVSFDEGIHRMAKWAKALGPQEMVYLGELEIVNEKTPTTWKEKAL
jgi:UDP-glucose 4-epimerase